MNAELNSSKNWKVTETQNSDNPFDTKLYREYQDGCHNHPVIKKTALAVKEELEREARDRMLSGGHPVEILPQGENGKTRDKIGEMAGVSGFVRILTKAMLILVIIAVYLV